MEFRWEMVWSSLSELLLKLWLMPDQMYHDVEDVLRRLAESVERKPNLASLAKILGLTYFVGAVGDTADAGSPHDSKRPLAMVVFSVSLEGGDGRVCGCSVPSTASLNSTKWSSTTIFVRATVTGRYAFFVI